MKRLGEILLDWGVIALSELHTGLDACRRCGGRLGTQLLKFGFVDELSLLEALTEQYGVPSASERMLRRVPQEIRKLLPPRVARRLQAIPFGRTGDSVRVAMVNPRDLAKREEIACESRNETRRSVVLVGSMRIMAGATEVRMTSHENRVQTFAELIRRASTQLPADVASALREGYGREAEGSLASKALETILSNIELAASGSAPICQDTGTPVVWIHHPRGESTRELEEAFEAAVRESTQNTYLRPNAVNTLTGKNTGSGTGRGIPYLHFEEWGEDRIEVRMLLKGGGSENVGAQYRLPDSRLKAGRDLDGVRRVVLDAVVQAQGKGCAPGVLGVCIGGDRASAFSESKRQLLRPLGDSNEDAQLASLEERLLSEGNLLGVGPMGFGGQTTLLGVKIGVLDRLPASYFVTISYMCWADRRAAVSIDRGGQVTWLS